MRVVIKKKHWDSNKYFKRIVRSLFRLKDPCYVYTWGYSRSAEYFIICIIYYIPILKPHAKKVNMYQNWGRGLEVWTCSAMFYKGLVKENINFQNLFRKKLSDQYTILHLFSKYSPSSLYAVISFWNLPRIKKSTEKYLSMVFMK